MTPELFSQLAAAGHNRIPVRREVLADTETPLSSYFKLANGPYSYLFESVQGGEKWGRYSIIGLPARERLEVRENTVQFFNESGLVESSDCDDPLEFVKNWQKSFNVAEVDGLPSFNGGLVGYFAYDCVRYVEPRLQGNAPDDEIGTPEILLMVSDEILVFDNLKGKIHLIVLADPARANALQLANDRLDALEAKLASGPGNIPAMPAMNTSKGITACEGDFESSYGCEKFQADVGRLKDYILAGDTMQIVLSQRMSYPFTAPPVNLYRALRCLNPSPYMYFMNLGDHHVVGSSPEILARLENGEMTVRPIAGTRRRGYSEAEDKALEAELVADPKEIAEHLMLIDLGRNDVGRVAEIGSVKLTEKMVVERFSHVMHITSNVTGRLKADKDAMDVLRAALPAGTLSGAPKIRAMEIIDELEPVKRGIYGGAIGYLAWNGNMDTAIAIRTAVIKDGKIFVQAGAGVVADSQPELEWKETMNKARALFSAVDWVV
ncbi:anthranilate synthase component I [Teredinibacter turnerae T7901]|uniref:Anthranilate synthase component 1 n=1 Tax=Teredinibacter turnerae (strain ATCC 39867 / T7901) TaxID=377629 RepID=C5BPB0_TERTT|nr:anthranilate synthase component I [Teredinibacter turnerae]ACR10708.1 anthranilate synthase component I [Teredinibacter turnerae T7901]